ncbi:hypothetical protein [Streptomyces carminius]|uniref:hypothetical protein n=1 Tax=Streptomyces carminius TaxID=2665496 RepID=UPI0011B544C9|nr:hypothetical protein [Streptomyces carminius]
MAGSLSSATRLLRGVVVAGVSVIAFSATAGAAAASSPEVPPSSPQHLSQQDSATVSEGGDAVLTDQVNGWQ